MDAELLDFQKGVISDLAGDIHYNETLKKFEHLVDERKPVDAGDGLCIIGAGLGRREILLFLLQVYCDSNALVFLLNTSPMEAESLKLSLAEKVAESCSDERLSLGSQRFHIIENSTNAKEREKMYLLGGLFCVTSRILIVDILRKRIPMHLATGMIVDDAHRVTETSVEAFILRKYRESNSTGFIKALSSLPGPFCHGINSLEKALKYLRLRRVILTPRFHSDVQAELVSNVSRPVDVIELKIPLSPRMKQIHDGLLACMEDALREFKKSSQPASMAASESTVEDTLLKSFEIQMHQQLDPIWNRVGYRTRAALADLRELRQLLEQLITLDPVAFHSHLETILEASSKSVGDSLQLPLRDASMWLLSDMAHVVFQSARDRVYRIDKRAQREGLPNGIVPQVEEPPKWKVLLDVYNEITADPELNGKPVLFVFGDRLACKQLFQYVQFKRKTRDTDPLCDALRRNFAYKSNLKSIRSNLAIMGGPASDAQVSSTPTREGAPNFKRRRVRGSGNSASAETGGIGELFFDPAIEHPSASGSPLDNSKAEEECSFDEKWFVQLDGSLLCAFRHLSSVHGDGDSFLDVLNEIKPQAVVCYDQNLAFVRNVEVYNARRCDDSTLRVYSLYYGNSFEEQTYLTAVRREKDNFERLIREKSVIAVPIDNDGRVVADLEDQFWKQVGKTVRHGGGGVVADSHLVIVDLREFRSSLPSLCDKKGLDVLAVTLEVGDYVLSPEICVERKSLSDLIGSLRSGRLYSQMEQMSLHYKIPVLLIEFDENRPFSLVLGGSLKQDITVQELHSKLVLLALSFPAMRIVWSSSPHASADIFVDLKQGRADPDEALAVSFGVNKVSQGSDMLSLYNPALYDLLLALPGVHQYNIRTILNSYTNLKQLVATPLEELKELLGVEASRKLYTFIHQKAAKS